MKEGDGFEKQPHMGENVDVHAFRGAGAGAGWPAPFKKGPTVPVSLFFLILLIGTFLYTWWSDASMVTGYSFRSSGISTKADYKRLQYSLNCSEGNKTKTCPLTSPLTIEPSNPSTENCPEYFRWIYEDLRPWTKTGITADMVESAKSPAHIRIVVVDGKLYVEKFKWVYQTRDVFTIWGILQLLMMYPGKLPDFDMMFECGDKPVISKHEYQGPNVTVPPPLFHYCGDDETSDIVFPDWSFWGWPEIQIKPWNYLRKDLERGNNRTKWIDREPYAYWKGNLRMGLRRHQLSKCDVNNGQDWNARIYNLDWVQETNNGFKSTDLSTQCTYKYKIYVEGAAWSVSEKYILACDSVTLLVTPQYYDFFTRSLQPLVHYWPIAPNDMCHSIKFATEWCNNHTQKAQEIGKAGSRFVQEELKMKFVYDYMFHLLSAYAKLFKYKPTVPSGAVEVCPDSMVCQVKEQLEKMYKIKSMVTSPSETVPCTMPPPYDPAELRDMLERKEHVMKQLQKLEKRGH